MNKVKRFCKKIIRNFPDYFFKYLEAIDCKINWTKTWPSTADGISIYATVPIPRGLNPNEIHMVASMIEPILLEKAFAIFESNLFESLSNI